MVNITGHSRDSINVVELAAFTYQAYSTLPIPYKYGETLEEIAMQNAELFVESGGKSLAYIPALNARRDHLSFLTQLVLRHLQGWPETSPAWDEESRRKALEESAARASAAGA